MPGPVDYNEIASAQLYDNELINLLNSDNPLQLKKVKIPNSDLELCCDVSTDTVRPYVPQKFKKLCFDSVHNLAHPAIRTTSKLVRNCFVRPSIKKGCTVWARRCIPCQRAKVHRHTIAPLQKFSDTSTRFDHVHIDLIGPLPTSQGSTFCMAAIDRFTRWSEATPILTLKQRQ
ncbi:pol polyprotein [Trichonephila clavipes]|nr:pol polyprotein [Trichonephila clavipes]